MAVLRPWQITPQLDKQSSLSIHQQLTQYFQYLIENSEWLAGDALPSTRDIAQQLQINRKTVARVYDELSARGLIYTEPKRGTFIAARHPSKSIATKQRKLVINEGDQRSLIHGNAINGLIQRSVIQHTRRAALQLHRLTEEDFDNGGLHRLRQILASFLAYERKLLIDPQYILCSNWLGIEQTLHALFKQRENIIVIDPKIFAVEKNRLQEQGIKTILLPLLAADARPAALIEEIEKFCINYPVNTLWIDTNTLIQANLSEILQQRLAQRIRDYRLLLIEDARSQITSMPYQPYCSQLSEHAIFLSSLYGQWCPLFNLIYMTVPVEIASSLKQYISIHHQQGLLLNMLAQSEILKRGEYKKLIHRIDNQHF